MFTDELVSCLTSNTVILIVGLLIAALVASIILTCCLGLKVQKLNQKLSTNKQNRLYNDAQLRNSYYPHRQDMHSFSYGRMVDLTN